MGPSSSSSGNLEDFIATVTFVPFNYDRLHMIRAYIDQQSVFGGTRLQIPRLEINRTLPAESIVFATVKEGQIEELKSLLRDGKASLRDHDQSGAPLLFVGFHNVNARTVVKLTWLRELRTVRYSAARNV